MGGRRRGSVAVGILMATVVFLGQLGDGGGGKGMAEAWKWPMWTRCFPGCLLGESCVVRMYNKCRERFKWENFYRCAHMATWWCDPTFFHKVQIVNDRTEPNDYYFGDDPPRKKRG